jgi:hypothetical protein
MQCYAVGIDDLPDPYAISEWDCGSIPSNSVHYRRWHEHQNSLLTPGLIGDGNEVGFCGNYISGFY